MENTQEICAICREENCDFETRCGHFYHEDCLESAVFSKDNKICPYCHRKISSFKLLEKLIRCKGDISNITLTRADIDGLIDLIKYGLEKESYPLASVVQEMVDLGWNIDELDSWLGKDKRKAPHSLFYASYVSGKVDLTHKLIELGCKIDQGKNNRKDRNESVLPHAVRINDIEFIEKLLGLGVDINGFDCYTSALNVACETDNVEMIKLLLENGAEYFYQGYYKRIDLMAGYKYKISINVEVNETPLTSACLNGSLNAVRYLHSHKPEIFDDDSAYWDAFATAIKLANIQLIDLLIELGGDISSESYSHINLLMIACVFGNIYVIKHVFDKGNFNINGMNSLGHCALYLSLMNRNSNTEISETVKFLIENGADPLSIICKYENFTVLHFACLSNNYELIEYLLTETAYSHFNFKKIKRAKRGLIELALFESGPDYRKIIDLLLQKGADINEKNFHAETAFSKAHNCSYEQIEFLISRGADVNSVDVNGLNCLQKIMNFRRQYYIGEKVLMLLVNNGIDLNHQDKRGWTIMHYICVFDFGFGIIGYLLDSGARTDIPDKRGFLPFDAALAQDKFCDTVKALEKNGVNYSKTIPEEVRSKPCDCCKGGNSSLKTRCGHLLHISCLNEMRKCPLCDTRVTVFNEVERIISEHNSDGLNLLTADEYFSLLENYIEDPSIFDFNSVTGGLKARKNSKDYLMNTDDKVPTNLYAKACAYNRFDLVKVFDSMCQNEFDQYTKYYVICCAVMSGNIELIEFILDKIGPGIINERLGAHYPIQVACQFGKLESFDYLIERGAYLNVGDEFPSLLHLACNRGSFEIVKKLVEDHEFDPNISSAYKGTPLYQTVNKIEQFSGYQMFESLG